MSLAADWDKIPTPAQGKSLADDWESIPAAKPEEPGYMSKIGDSARKFQAAVDKDNALMTAPKAVGEVALNAVTGAPLTLLKHGVEEGAYLSGQAPQQAATTAQRVIPVDGYQPQSEAGQALGELAGNVVSPLVDAGKWAAQKLGLSPAAQNIAGDFAPVVVPKVASAVGKAVISPLDTVAKASNIVQTGIENAKAMPGLTKDIASQGSLSAMRARFNQLADQGNAPASQNAITPQMLRGQEPLPESVKEVPKQAPEITPENASPELKAVLDKTQNLGQEAVKRQLEADSLPVKMQLSPGQAANDIHKLSDEFNMRGTKEGAPLADLFNRQNSNLIDNVNAIRDRAAPKASGLDHVENGESLMTAYQTADAQLRNMISDKYKALEEANGGQFPLDGKSFVDAADEALAKKLKTHYVPADVRATLNDLREGGKMTFEDFETLRSDLAETARSATDGKVRQAASIIRQKLEDMPMPEGAEHLKPLADAARSAAKSRFDLLDKDPAYKAAVNESTPPDKFVQKYIINGNKNDLQQMRENLAGDPVAHENIAAAAINYLKSRAGIVNDNGNFSQAGYNKALEQLKPKLDYLFDPVTAQQIQTLGNVSRYTQLQPKGSYFNNSNTFVSAAKGAAEGALNVKTYGLSGVVKDAFTSGKKARAAQEAVKPGAGIQLKDIGKNQ